MAETAGSTPTASEVGKKIEPRDNRETVVNAFNSSFSLLEQVPEDQLSQEEIWTKQAIKAAKEKTIDQKKDTFTNSFANLETGETYTQEEGIPLEGLLEFLRKRAEPLAPDSDEKKELIRLAHVLYRNSQPFTRLPHRMEPARLLGRVRQEAYFASKDVRATGSDFDNWLKGERTLMARLELVLPLPGAQPTVAPTLEEQPELEAAPAQPAIETAEQPAEEAPLPAAGPEAPQTEAAPAAAELAPKVIEPVSIQERRYNINVINATEGASKYAHLEARKDVTESLRRGQWWQLWDWPRKIGLRWIEPAAVLNRRNRLYRAMVKNNTSFLTMPEVKNSANLAQRQAEAREQEKAVVKRFKEGGIRSGEKVETAKGELRAMLLNEILRPITQGQLTTRDQVRERLAQFVKTHLNDSQVETLFGASANDFGDTAELFATDVLETGLNIRADMEANNETFEQIDQYIDIRLGYAKLGHMTETRDVVDRAVAWANRKRSNILATGARGLGYRGIILNPFVIGVGASIATVGIMRAAGVTGKLAQIPSLLVGGGAGALVAGARRYYDLGVYDRPQHMAQRTLGEEMPIERGSTKKQREALEKRRYNMATVDQLRSGGGTELTSGTGRISRTDLLALNLAEGDPQQRLRNIEALARRRAEIQTRLDLSVELRKDLIGYKNKLEADISPTDLTEDTALYGAKIKEYYRQQFKAAGLSDQDVETRAQEELNGLDTRFKGDWKEKLISNVEEQDRDFQGYRLRQALGSAVFGGAAGLAGGFVTQEGFAQIARHFPEVANIPVIGGWFQKGETLREQLMREHGLKLPGIPQAPAAPPTPSAGTFVETTTTNVFLDPKTGVEANDITGHRTFIPKGTEWARDPVDSNKWDLRVLGKPDKILIDDARFDSSGKLVDWNHATSQNSLFGVENSSQGTEVVTGAQAVSEWEKLKTPIDHREWYAYDKPGSQGNELRLYTAKDGDAVTLDMSKMNEGFQKGLAPNPIDVREVIKNHQSGFMFSIPGPEEKLVSVWIPDGVDGVWDGKLRLDPNDMTHFVEFNGKKMPLGEFSKMVLNQNALNPLSNGDIATELYNRQDVFKLGVGGKTGFIEAGTLVDRPEGKVLQAFATIRGNGTVQAELPKGFVAEVTLKGSWVEEIRKLVPAPEAPQPQPIEVEGEAPPIIPIPFAPRHPLEPLKKGEAIPQAPLRTEQEGEAPPQAEQAIADQALPESDKLKAAKDELVGLQQGLKASGLEPNLEQQAELKRRQAEVERLERETAPPEETLEGGMAAARKELVKTLEDRVAATTAAAPAPQPPSPAAAGPATQPAGPPPAEPNETLHTEAVTAPTEIRGLPSHEPDPNLHIWKPLTLRVDRPLWQLTRQEYMRAIGDRQSVPEWFKRLDFIDNNPDLVEKVIEQIKQGRSAANFPTRITPEELQRFQPTGVDPAEFYRQIRNEYGFEFGKYAPQGGTLALSGGLDPERDYHSVTVRNALLAGEKLRPEVLIPYIDSFPPDLRARAEQIIGAPPAETLEGQAAAEPVPPAGPPPPPPIVEPLESGVATASAPPPAPGQPSQPSPPQTPRATFGQRLAGIFGRKRAQPPPAETPEAQVTVEPATSPSPLTPPATAAKAEAPTDFSPAEPATPAPPAEPSTETKTLEATQPIVQPQIPTPMPARGEPLTPETAQRIRKRIAGIQTEKDSEQQSLIETLSQSLQTDSQQSPQPLKVEATKALITEELLNLGEENLLRLLQKYASLREALVMLRDRDIPNIKAASIILAALSSQANAQKILRLLDQKQPPEFLSIRAQPPAQPPTGPLLTEEELKALERARAEIGTMGNPPPSFPATETTAPAPEPSQPPTIEAEVPPQAKQVIADQTLSDHLAAAEDELARFQKDLEATLRPDEKLSPEQKAELERLAAEVERLQQKATAEPAAQPAGQPPSTPVVRPLEGTVTATIAPTRVPSRPRSRDYFNALIIETTGRKLDLTRPERETLVATLKEDYFKDSIFKVGNTHVEQARLEEIVIAVIDRWNKIQPFSEREGDKKRLEKSERTKLDNIQKAVRELMPKEPKEPKEKDLFRKTLSWQLLYILDKDIYEYSAGEVQAFVNAIRIIRNAQIPKRQAK